MTEIRAASSLVKAVAAEDAVFVGFDVGFSSDRFEILYDESFAATVRRLSKYL